jgi:hypothetical protein
MIECPPVLDHTHDVNDHGCDRVDFSKKIRMA